MLIIPNNICFFIMFHDMFDLEENYKELVVLYLFMGDTVYKKYNVILYIPRLFIKS